MQRVWDGDTAQRTQFWSVVRKVSGHRDIDPIARAALARALVELVKTYTDAAGAVEYYKERPDAAFEALREIFQEARLALVDKATLAFAWAPIVRDLLEVWISPSLYPVRLVLASLTEIRDAGQSTQAATAAAARSFFKLSFQPNVPPQREAETQIAISCLAKTFAQDPTSGRALILKLFDPARQGQHSFEDLPTLCRELEPIIDADPDFAADIYARIYNIESSGSYTHPDGKSEILPRNNDQKAGF